jgi:hypothetical protein
LTPQVFGYRFKQSADGWYFAGHGAWKRFTGAAVELVYKPGVNAMCSTDVAGYFPSIQANRLSVCLRQLGCERNVVDVINDALTHFAVAGVPGLPVGPESSTLLGNAYLVGVDRRLLDRRTSYIRWMDDFRSVAADADGCYAFLDAFDEILADERLARSEAKTAVYHDRRAAVAALRNGRLASLAHWLDMDVSRTTDELHEAWEWVASQQDVPLRDFRFVVKSLRNRHDPYAALTLTRDTHLANLDPRLSGDYAAKAALGVRGAVDGIFGILEKLDGSTDALGLHYLRALTLREGGWGSAEGTVFTAIVDDESRPPAVRAWAVTALGRSAAWRQTDTFERATAEDDPLVRRALVVSLKKVRSSRRRDTFLQDMAARHSALRWTIGWVMAT